MATASAAVFGAAAALRLCDAAAALRARARLRAAATVRSTTRARTGVAAAPSPEEPPKPRPAPPAAAPPSCCDVAVASLRRPCFAALLARELAMHPALLIAGAGPEPMLADVGLASSNSYPTPTPTPTPNPNTLQVERAISALRRGGGHAPQHRMVRLTHSM